jgi:membrane-associated protease RseP (regulator of RpoE activity)
MSVGWLTSALHEMSHLAAARWFGLRILRIQIASFPIIATKRFAGVRWRIGVFSLGGAVAIYGEGKTCDAIPASQRAGAWPCAPAKHRLITAAAGPASNVLVAAILLVWIIVDFHSGNRSLVSLLKWALNFHEILSSMRRGDSTIAEQYSSAVTDGILWAQSREASAAVSGFVINAWAVVTNVSDVPFRDGWHVRRCLREMRGQPPLSQEDWDAQRRRAVRKSRVAALSAGLIIIAVAAGILL